MDFAIFIAAMAALIYGADFVIKESEKIALHFEISHFVIGATLVAFGTSLPEMAASMMASYRGASDMAVANVIGSVIFNIAMVLGVVFLLAGTIRPDRDLFAKDSAWVLLPVIVFLVMIHDGAVGRFDGVLFLTMMVAYLFFLFTGSRGELVDEMSTVEALEGTLEKEAFGWTKTLALLLLGFIFTIGGAHFVIESGSQIARTFGVSEWIIGLFLIAFGTSLPELVVSLVAIRKGNADMSIGNIIGSNVANFSMVLGSAALVSPLSVNAENMFDIYLMTAASVVLLLLLANRLYNRAGGVILLIMLALFFQNALA